MEATPSSFFEIPEPDFSFELLIIAFHSQGLLHGSPVCLLSNRSTRTELFISAFDGCFSANARARSSQSASLGSLGQSVGADASATARALCAAQWFVQCHIHMYGPSAS
jgi:hypothetical protein